MADIRLRSGWGSDGNVYNVLRGLRDFGNQAGHNAQPLDSDSIIRERGGLHLSLSLSLSLYLYLYIYIYIYAYVLYIYIYILCIIYIYIYIYIYIFVFYVGGLGPRRRGRRAPRGAQPGGPERKKSNKPKKVE